METGRHVVAAVLREPETLKLYVDAGFDMTWMTAKDDYSRAAVFADEDADAFKFILGHYAKHRQVPSLAFFQASYPAKAYRLPAAGYTTAELVELASRDRARSQLLTAGTAFMDLHDADRFDEAIELMAAAIKRERSHVSDGLVRLEWDSKGYDLESKLDRHEEQGVPIGIEELDRGFAGWQPSQLITFVGRAKACKALALDTKIPTPTGWTTMRAIQEGDEVFDSMGKICRVTSATPVMLDHTCYKVSFRSGESFIADAGHLWVTEQLGRTANDWQEGVRTTEDIRQTLKMHGRNAHRVHVAGGLDLPEADLPIDPYIIGYWLGDGTSSKPEITCSDSDLPSLRAKVKDAGLYILSERRNGANSARIWLSTYPVQRRGKHDTFKGALRAAGVLRNKHIPGVYLRASFAQRLALLQGLMDSDGTMSERYDATFTSIYADLAHQVHELCESLGIRAKVLTRTVSLNGDDMGLAYLVNIVPGDAPVFTLTRKLEKGIARTRGTKHQYRYVESVTPHYSVPVKCIMVDSPDHTYLIGEGFIPTHNTSHLVKSALAAHDAGYNVLLASVEVDANEIADRCDSFAAGVEPERYMSGRLTDSEKKKVRAKKSERGVDEFFHIIQPTGTFTVDSLEAEIDRYNPGVVYVDGFYFMTDRHTKKSGGQWEGHDNLARELKEIAMRRGVTVVVTMQIREKQQHGKGQLDDNTMMGGTGLNMASNMVFTLDMDRETGLNSIINSRSRSRYLKGIAGEWQWKYSDFQVRTDEEWNDHRDDDDE